VDQARVASDVVRIVPSTKAVSGMMFVVVPASMWAIVTTAGSKTSTRRVTIACSASTISAATGIGSIVSWGAEAWPPRPRIVRRMKSAATSIAPGL
jgi:hypothetical protein